MIKKEIVFATTNPFKVEVLQRVLGDEYLVKSMKDFSINVQTEEDGNSTEENAIKKARALYEKIKQPCFAVDFGLYIDGLPDAEQPKDRVKRNVVCVGSEPTDEEVLCHYVKLVKNLGGRVDAYWLRSIAIVSENGEFFSSIKLPKTLVDITSKVIPQGSPFTAIQIDPLFNKYESELTPEEKLKSHEIEDSAVRDFIISHF